MLHILRYGRSNALPGLKVVPALSARTPGGKGGVASCCGPPDFFPGSCPPSVYPDGVQAASVAPIIEEVPLCLAICLRQVSIYTMPRHRDDRLL